jgi:hypothetical protein
LPSQPQNLHPCVTHWKAARIFARVKIYINAPGNRGMRHLGKDEWMNSERFYATAVTAPATQPELLGISRRKILSTKSRI